jgi:hypothetical protein
MWLLMRVKHASTTKNHLSDRFLSSFILGSILGV